MKTYCKRRIRRGGVYIFVLGSSLMVGLIGMSAIALTQIGARSAAQSNDVADASALAESGVELALMKFAGDSNWQTDYPAGTATTPVSVGAGTVSFKWSSVSGGVRIYGIGKVHNATRIYSIKATLGQPVASLQSAAFAGTSITLPTLGTVSGGGTITSNGTVGGLLPIFSVPTTVQYYTSTVLGIITNLLKVALGAPATTADTSHVFDYYTTNGTDITSHVPTVSGNLKLQYALLAPGANTVGGGNNAQGVYVINCNNTTIQIANCRVLGTLVLLNPGTNSVVNGSVYFAPAVVGYPSLMVKGNMILAAGTAALADSSSQNINFNQSGAPYSGVTDSTFTTTYPCRFEGVVYVSGNLTATAATFIGSTIVNGTFTVNSSVSFTYDPTVYTNAAPGFSSSQLTTVPASWQWETGP